MIVRVLSVLAAAVLLATGCSPADPGPPPPSPVVVPAELVGTWTTVTERNNVFSYEFSDDGRYLHVGIMRDGAQQYTLQEGGRTAVTATEIRLTPQIVRLTRTDAGQPTTTTTPTKPPRTVKWSVSGRALTLIEGGSPTRYERE